MNQNELEDVIVELDNLYQKRQAQFQDTFLTKIFCKVTANLKDNQKRSEVLGFLVDVAGDNLNDKRFMQFLSENVGDKYKSQRLANILSSHKVLILDPIEMRYAFLNWNIPGIMPIVPTSVTETSQKRRLS